MAPGAEVRSAHQESQLLAVTEYAPGDGLGLKALGLAEHAGHFEEVVDCAHDAEIRLFDRMCQRSNNRVRRQSISATFLTMLPEIVARIHERLAAVGLTASAASLAAGLSDSAIRNLERRAQKGSEGSANVTTLSALAPVLKTTVEYLLRGSNNSTVMPMVSGVRWVPLVGEVRAGAFLEAFEQEEPFERLPYTDPQYDRAELFALRVVGNSMDLEYPDGTIVICARAVQAGICEGDHVVLRRRDITGKVETTLKEIILNNGGVEFWPRSSDPKYQTPFVPPPQDADDQHTWEIDGVVVSIYRKRPPRRGIPIST